jgi:hypothetical protein
MNTHEIIGMTIFGFALLIATAQAAFAWGRIVGTRSERQLADRRINGLLAQENARRPKAAKNKRKPPRRGKLLGTIVANGTSFVI